MLLVLCSKGKVKCRNLDIAEKKDVDFKGEQLPIAPVCSFPVLRHYFLCGLFLFLSF